MSYVTIPIPGGTTVYDEAPDVRIESLRDGPVHLVIRYYAGPKASDGSVPKGIIIFQNVLEYRWTSSSFEYEEYDEHRNDYEFGLIEILHSRYVERMASRGPMREFPGRRFGDVINEADVKHYRIGFDDYGQFDIIALSVSVMALSPEQA